MKSAAVVYVKDLRRMASFYGTCFGMHLVDAADDYRVLDSEPLTLTLVRTPDPVAETIVMTVPPSRRENVPIKLGFAAVNIDALRPIFLELGGVVDPPETQWAFRGAIHCDGIDPEGNVLQLVQLIAQAPASMDG